MLDNCLYIYLVFKRLSDITKRQINNEFGSNLIFLCPRIAASIANPVNCKIETDVYFLSEEKQWKSLRMPEFAS